MHIFSLSDAYIRYLFLAMAFWLTDTHFSGYFSDQSLWLRFSWEWPCSLQKWGAHSHAGKLKFILIWALLSSHLGDRKVNQKWPWKWGGCCGKAAWLVYDTFLLGRRTLNVKKIVFPIHSLRTFAPIVSAHPYCARKCICYVIHQARAQSTKINKW